MSDECDEMSDELLAIVPGAFFMPNFAVRNLSGEKGRPSFREVIINEN